MFINYNDRQIHHTYLVISLLCPTLGDQPVRLFQRQHPGPALDLLHALPLPLHRGVQVGLHDLNLLIVEHGGITGGEAGHRFLQLNLITNYPY